MNDPDGLSEQEIKEGYVLSCVGQPLTDDVVIEIG
jgi:ring-1,2-phenylacetyl-CoA epoxidase subunit PaaE